MIPQYLDLNKKGGAPARLVILRNMAAHTNAPDVNMPPSRRFADWRAARTQTLLTGGHDLCAGYNTESDGTKINVWSTFSAPNFRDERNADDIEGARIRHRGWFADADCSNTVRGIVGRLSHGRFIAGYKVSDTGEHVYLDHVFDDEVSAAYDADEFAREYAEQAKEYDERWQAAHALNDEIAEVSRNVARMFKLRHTDGFDSAADYRDLEYGISELRTLKEKRAEYSDVEL
jgi:hypothetical protein